MHAALRSGHAGIQMRQGYLHFPFLRSRRTIKILQGASETIHA